ncbi:hypothetical protein GO290_01926 [Ralstonia solanacearum]|nr:hypothetical protein [Ralstonia solanacearum]
MLAREMATIEEERASLRTALTQTDIIGKQVRELVGAGSAYSQMAKELKALQSPAMSIAQQYKDLLGPGSAVGDAFKAWKESERAQFEHMRKILEPMADIRKSLLGDNMTQQLIKELTEGSSIRSYMKEFAEQTSGIGSIAKLLAQQVEESRAQTKRFFERLSVGSSIRSYLKDFEYINTQWKVPSEVLGIVGSFKEIQEQLGLAQMALPTIDWGSAAALATVLGQEGIQEQLALLGIQPDGSMHPPSEMPEKGILSRKQADVITLISFLLIFVIFFYQEYNSAQQQAKTDASQTQNTATLRLQAKQIQNLTILIEKALVQAAQEPEERFVVRSRTATVRSKPEYGAAVEGKLLPNEVVRAIDKDGKWVEVEYYHWLHEEYRTGWVLKKYLERVPATYSNRSK